MARASLRQCREFVHGPNPFYQLLRSDSINGFAVGRKVVQGKATGDLAITVFVSEKLPLGHLALAQRIPQVFGCQTTRRPTARWSSSPRSRRRAFTPSVNMPANARRARPGARP